MIGNPLSGTSWVQALAQNSPWNPPAEWAADYPWIAQLPQALPNVSAGRVISPPQYDNSHLMEPREGDTPWLTTAPMTEYSDVPSWLQALNDDATYQQNRVIDSPYGGWGGGAMQARRRGLR